MTKLDTQFENGATALHPSKWSRWGPCVPFCVSAGRLVGQEGGGRPPFLWCPWCGLFQGFSDRTVSRSKRPLRGQIPARLSSPERATRSNPGFGTYHPKFGDHNGHTVQKLACFCHQNGNFPAEIPCGAFCLCAQSPTTDRI